MTKSKVLKISYSDVYYRPQDTPVASAGWYVDKIVFIGCNNIVLKTECRPIKFNSYELARKFSRKRLGLK